MDYFPNRNDVMCWLFGRVVCPIVHKGATLLDEVGSGVSSLGLIALIVSQSQLADFSRIVGALVCPVAKARPEAMSSNIGMVETM
ncbi:hypothetical protein D3C87_2013030 [compost metagenome]